MHSYVKFINVIKICYLYDNLRIQLVTTNYVCCICVLTKFNNVPIIYPIKSS